jgi:hypothetical protein
MSFMLILFSGNCCFCIVLYLCCTPRGKSAPHFAFFSLGEALFHCLVLPPSLDVYRSLVKNELNDDKYLGIERVCPADHFNFSCGRRSYNADLISSIYRTIQ